MKKTNKYYLFFLVLFFLLETFISSSLASDDKKFLSLKKNEVNLRQGPSLEYPIKLIYKKKYLPVIILDKSGPFRKIRDFENNTGWIHIALLSKKKSAINIQNNSILYKKPTIYSKPLAKLESGRLVMVKKCKVKWCKIESGDYQGWIYKKNLWGRIK
jgi:SH3-like domain-containing protein